ncbi:hypothetical protein ACN47E_003191 [Coniothyrium glycines]
MCGIDTEFEDEVIPVLQTAISPAHKAPATNKDPRLLGTAVASKAMRQLYSAAKEATLIPVKLFWKFGYISGALEVIVDDLRTNLHRQYRSVMELFRLIVPFVCASANEVETRPFNDTLPQVREGKQTPYKC